MKKKIDVSHDREIQAFAQRLVDEAISMQGLMNYLLDTPEMGRGVAELGDMIDAEYAQLVELHGEDPEVDARLDAIEEQKLFYLGVAIGRRLGPIAAMEDSQYRRTLATISTHAANVRVPAISKSDTANIQKALRTVNTGQKKAKGRSQK